MDGEGIVETNVSPFHEVDHAIELQQDGKLVAVGNALMSVTKSKGSTISDYDGVLVRYNADGSLDSSFSGDGIQTTNIAGMADNYWDLAIQSDQKLVAIGNARGTGKRDYGNMAVVRHLADGSLDASFSGDGKAFADFGVMATAYSGQIQSDGKIVVAGSVWLSTRQFGIARFNADGTLDTSFGNGGKVTTNFGVGSVGNGHNAEDLLIQPDGKIIVAGGGGGYFLLARYNPNGMLDTSFDGDGKVVHNTGGVGLISKLALQPDGKIVAVGLGNTGEGIVARYNSDGSLDSSFAGSGVLIHPDITSSIQGVGIQSDGKIVVSGGPDWKASRLNPDGTLDTTFGGTGSVQVMPDGEALSQDLLIQPDGKTVMSGYRPTVGNFVTARLNSDGSFDTSFGGGSASASSSSLASVETTVAPAPPNSSSSISALDAASIQQLLAEPEAKNAWTRKSRIKLFAL